MAENSIIKSLIEIQAELKAPKDKMNNYGKYKYRSCESILEAVKPLLKKHGLVIRMTDKPVIIGERYYIEATVTLMNEGGAGVSTTAYAREADGKSGMDPAQLTGACSSYARKYALNGLFAIDDTKDADTNEFQEENKAKKTAPKKETHKPDFGTASEQAKDVTDVELPFDIKMSDAEIKLRELMQKDGITEDQVLKAFKGKYSAIENIEEDVINTRIIKKWSAFVKAVKGGN